MRSAKRVTENRRVYCCEPVWPLCSLAILGSNRDPLRSGKAISNGSGFVGGFSGSADVFYAFFILVKG